MSDAERNVGRLENTNVLEGVLSSCSFTMNAMNQDANRLTGSGTIHQSFSANTDKWISLAFQCGTFYCTTVTVT